jgi:hypothetical protein
VVPALQPHQPKNAAEAVRAEGNLPAQATNLITAVPCSFDAAVAGLVLLLLRHFAAREDRFPSTGTLLALVAQQ